MITSNRNYRLKNWNAKTKQETYLWVVTVKKSKKREGQENWDSTMTMRELSLSGGENGNLDFLFNGVYCICILLI